jgi:hypothetical protein
MTYLEARVTPRGQGNYLPLGSTTLEIRLLDVGVGLPGHITVEVRGRVRPHLVAFWDGCAYRL